MLKKRLFFIQKYPKTNNRQVTRSPASWTSSTPSNHPHSSIPLDMNTDLHHRVDANGDGKAGFMK
jgi:hypothetical protein